MLILAVLVLLCAGCGVKFRKNANAVINNIKEKI